MSVDPLADKFPELTTYQYASNSPVAMIDLDGLEGVKYTELDDSGNAKRHVVELEVRVVTVARWDKKNGKRPKDRVSSSYTSIDVATVRSQLNMMFNGVDGKGSQNSAGETVYFKFNVQEFSIGKNESLTQKDLQKISIDGATESGQVQFETENGQKIFEKSPINFIIGAIPGSYVRGSNNNIVTKIHPKEISDGAVLMHETLHQFLTRTEQEEHAIGGGLETPPGPLTRRNIVAILEDALEKKPQ